MGDSLVKRRHRHRRIGDQRRDGLIDRPRIDQRLVALHVDDDVAVERFDHFSESIGAALNAWLSSAGRARRIRRRACAMRKSSVATITRDTDGCRAGPAVYVFDHRLAVDVRERLAGETCRGESSGDDGDDLQRIRGIDRRNSR